MANRIVRVLLFIGAIAGLTLVNVANAQITFRAASSSAVVSPTFRSATSATLSTISFRSAASASFTASAGTLTITKPAGTVANDVMIASIGFRPNTATITAPAGWTLVRRIDNASTVSGGAPDSLAIYRKSATAEGASYAWTFAGATDAAGGIQSFIGVDTLNPIDVENGQNTAFSGSHATPDVTTTVANTMLVTSHTFASSDTWTPPAGMTESFDVASQGTNNVLGQATEGNRVAQAATGATGTKTATIGNSPTNDDEGNAHILALKPGLQINKPAGVTTNDVLVASIGVRPSTATITTPAGWTLVRRTDNANGNSNSLAVYYRVATALDIAFYTWSVKGADFMVGGIQAFVSVDTTAPVNVDLGNCTLQGSCATVTLTHATPSVTTTAANSMIVTSHTLASAAAWSPPAGMTEAYDQASGAIVIGAPGQSIEGNRVQQVAAGATGTDTATASADADVGNAHILALRLKMIASLVINKPTAPNATAAGDVMIASIGFRPNTLTVTPPAGWTLVLRIDNANATANSLAVYRLVAGASEPSSYTWTFSAAGYLAGGIVNFSGVDTTNPIDIGINALDGQNTPSGVTHSTPNRTTSVANTMLVTSHTYASGSTWTPPAGMTEGVDVQHGPESLEVNYVLQATAGATGIKTATAGGGSDTGNAHVLALRPAAPVVPTPGSFNAFETSTAAGAITGVIRTKVAGTAFSLDVVAIAGGIQQAGFTDTVLVDLLGNNTLGVALDANNCPTSSTTVQTVSPNPTITGGRSTVSFAAVPNSWQDVRVRVRWTTASPTVTKCSTDNFAIRPNALASFAVTDTDAQSTGAPGLRALNDVTFGAVFHKAGRPFSVRATAVNAAAVTTTNYVGAPTATLTACAGAACTATFGALTLTTTFVAGQLSSDAASYNNVGSFALQLIDTSFASVDAGDTAADCTSTGRYVCSGTLTAGRFVPDHFAVALNTPTFGAACTAGSFTYIGQTFNYTTVPVITVTAQDFANNTTTLYATSGSWWRITNASLTGTAYTAATGTLDTGGLPGTDPVIVSTGAGVGTLTFGSGLAFTRTTPTAPASPYNADISLAINVIDADGVAFAGNPARFAAATTNNGIGFSSGKTMRFGRLRLQNAVGSAQLALPVPIETQYWNGSAFARNTQDSCTTLARSTLTLSSYAVNLAACETAVSQSTISFAAGLGTLTLSPAGTGNSGSVLLTANLGTSASGNFCPASPGAESPATAANRAYLQGAWAGSAFTDNPSARATFGLFSTQPSNFIFFRENY